MGLFGKSGETPKYSRHSKLLKGFTPSEGVGYKLPEETDGILMCQDQQEKVCPNTGEELFSELKSIEMLQIYTEF